jgi:hypothetical protein
VPEEDPVFHPLDPDHPLDPEPEPEPEVEPEPDVEPEVEPEQTETLGQLELYAAVTAAF